MNKIKVKLNNMADKIRENNEIGAKRNLLNELFSDMYEHRREIYKMNFIRGILFGFGSALGGTVILAIVVFILSQVLGAFLGEGWIHDFKDFVNSR